MIDLVKNVETVRETVGVFDDADTLQEAINDLQAHGFLWHELSILADDKTVAKKLGHIYQRVEDAEDDLNAPRKVFVPKESISLAAGVLIGAPLYLAGTIAAELVAASDGTLLQAILAVTAASVCGAAIGAILAKLVTKRYADYIQAQLEHGGLLLWVHLRSPAMQAKSKKILKKHLARDVHVHEIPVYH